MVFMTVFREYCLYNYIYCWLKEEFLSISKNLDLSWWVSCRNIASEVGCFQNLKASCNAHDWLVRFPVRSSSSGSKAEPNHWSKRYVKRFPSSTTCVESEMMLDTEEAPPPPAPQAVSAGPHAPPPPQIYNFPTNFPVQSSNGLPWGHSE